MVNGYQTAYEPQDDILSPQQEVREVPDIVCALSRLITPHLTRKVYELGVRDGTDWSTLEPVIHDFPASSTRGQYLRSLAKLLNTDSVTPYLIWNGNCRVELQTMLDSNIASLVATVGFVLAYFDYC